MMNTIKAVGYIEKKKNDHLQNYVEQKMSPKILEIPF